MRIMRVYYEQNTLDNNNSLKLQMPALSQFGMFLIGLSDSISLEWVKGILLYTDPQTRNALPQSKNLLKTLIQSVIQAGVILTFIPIILRFIGLDLLASIVTFLALILTYGYLFFYNSDILTLTKEIVIWKARRDPGAVAEMDVKERVEIFTDLSNQIKSIVFLLLFYFPIFICAQILTIFSPLWGSILLLISQSFFNSAFYFFRKWPYDKYNVGFMQKNVSYFLGYGLFVSLVCNIILPPSLARGGYFLISQWMVINAIIHSPPVQNNVQLWSEIKVGFAGGQGRRRMINGYNTHRQSVRNSPEYRKKIIDDIVLLKLLFTITESINLKLARLLENQQRVAAPAEQPSPTKKQ